MRLWSVLVLVAVGLAGCSHAGTPSVDRVTMDRIVASANRLEVGMTRDAALGVFSAGERGVWGRGIGVGDESIAFEEWRIFAEDSADQPNSLSGMQQWGDAPSGAMASPTPVDEIRTFELWLYFESDELYEWSATRRPLIEQDGVRATWRRSSRLGVWGEHLEPSDDGPLDGDGS